MPSIRLTKNDERKRERVKWIIRSSNLLSFLLRCGTRLHKWGAQWDSNSLVKVCKSRLLTITPPESITGIDDDISLQNYPMIVNILTSYLRYIFETISFIDTLYLIRSGHFSLLIAASHFVLNSSTPYVRLLQTDTFTIFIKIIFLLCIPTSMHKQDVT